MWSARQACAELLGGEPGGVVCGESMTSLTMRFAAAVGRTLGPGDESVLSDRTRWAAGARTYVDAVAATPHRRIQQREWGADAVVCSAYKWYGTHLGVLCAGPGVLAELRPDKLNPSPDSIPLGWVDWAGANDAWEIAHRLLEAVAAIAAGR